MSYNIKFDDITSVQVESQKTINAWGESVASLNKAMSDFINNKNLQGQAISSMRNYLVEVHGTLLQTLVTTFQGGDPLVPIDETVEPTFEDGSKEKSIPPRLTLLKVILRGRSSSLSVTVTVEPLEEQLAIVEAQIQARENWLNQITDLFSLNWGKAFSEKTILYIGVTLVTVGV
ncbi:hypothetical protein V470_11050 [Streptococcus sp. VT 162]|nr:hypothetical protein V470_11050 [Streptococcus sp. VT 162]